MWTTCRSRRGRSAVVSGTVAFPVLDGYGDAGLSVMELSCKGVLTVPSLANYVWGSEVTITAYVFFGSVCRACLLRVQWRVDQCGLDTCMYSAGGVVRTPAQCSAPWFDVLEFPVVLDVSDSSSARCTATTKLCSPTGLERWPAGASSCRRDWV